VRKIVLFASLDAIEQNVGPTQKFQVIGGSIGAPGYHSFKRIVLYDHSTKLLQKDTHVKLGAFLTLHASKNLRASELQN